MASNGKRSKSSPQRGSSRSPRREPPPPVPVDDFDKRSEPSSAHSSADGPPGQDCTLGDLRWFVVREIGDLKRNFAILERTTERNSMQLDVAKAKNREKLDLDQVNANVAKALEKVPHLVDF